MTKLAQRCGQLIAGRPLPTVLGKDGVEQILSPLAAAVWQAADGTRDAAALLMEARLLDADATPERVFKALDELYEGGLLDAPVAPPTEGLDRRGLFKRFAIGAAAAVVAAPAVAKAAEGEACADDSAFHKAEAYDKQMEKQFQSKVKQEEQQKQKAEHYYENKGSDDTQGEQASKQQGKKEEQALKADPRYLQKSTRNEQNAKAFSKARPFGVGQSLIALDIPGYELPDGQTDLSNIVLGTNENGCTITFEVDHSTPKETDSFVQVLNEAIKSGKELAIQFGPEGEFASVGKVISVTLEAKSFDASIGLPKITPKIAKESHG